uniref:Uncharacterized protein n=1 Tax=Clastoptera arizonana TaxID=38151 RepID=A0A1B6C512_9HEMI
MLGHYYMNQVYDWLKTSIKDNYRLLETIRNGLFIYNKYENQSSGKSDEFQSKLKYWQAELSRWNTKNLDMINNLHYHKKIKLSQTECELINVGNIRYIEVKSNTNFTKHLKKLIKSFLCPYILKEVSIENVSLDNVIQIDCNNELRLSQLYFCHQLANSSTDEIFLISQPFSVQSLSDWSFDYIHDYFFEKKISEPSFSVTNCFAIADKELEDPQQIHYKLLLRSESLAKTKFGVITGLNTKLHSKFKMDVFHSHNFSKQKPLQNEKVCQQYSDILKEALVPLFIVEYHYIFQDYYKPLKDINFTKTTEIKYEYLINLVKIMEIKMDIQLITTLDLPSSNIFSLDRMPIMENVVYVNLSSNYIEDVTRISSMFPSIVTLNLSYNNIISLNNLEDMEKLEHLEIQWNKINEFLASIKKLKTLKTILKFLDLSYNPFTDIIHESHVLYFVCKNLPSLEKINGDSIKRVYCNNNFVLKDHEQLLTINIKNQSVLTKFKSELCTGETNENENHLIQSEDKIICVTITNKYINNFRSVLPLEHVKLLNLSYNILSTTEYLKKMPSLEEINLSNNVFEDFNCSQVKLANLVKLDLSSNFLTTLDELRTSTFPSLKIFNVSCNKLSCLTGTDVFSSLEEFYASHNNIAYLDSLVAAKKWKLIKVFDLSSNPISEHPLFRNFCIYNLKTIEFINGQEIVEGEAENAEYLFGGWLDQDYLGRLYTRNELSNLTQLTLTNCSINKVLLQKQMPKIQNINMEGNKITTLNWLNWFPNAVSVCLSHNTVYSYNDLSPEYDRVHTSLSSLYLNNNKIKSLVPLKLGLFKKLQNLYLQDNEIVSFEGLNGLSHLNNLILDFNKISNINSEEVSGLINLKHLFLESNNLTDLTFLRAVPHLTNLYLSKNNIKDKTQLDHFSAMKDIVEICIQGNPLFKNENYYKDLIASLPNLKQIEGYVIESNKASNVTTLGPE